MNTTIAMPSIAPHDLLDRATRLYGKPEEEITPAMLARVTVTQIPLSPVDAHERSLGQKGFARWHSCPRCTHSSTGKYLGNHACTRCGYKEGSLA